MEKTINHENVEMLFETTLSEFRLSQAFAKKFPESDNSFRSEFYGLRKAIDILGFGAEYIAFVAGKDNSND